MNIKVCIDRGGTFTDCIAFIPAHIHPEHEPGKDRVIVLKLLSEDPLHYSDAPREGIRRILEMATGKPHPRDVPVDTSLLSVIRMGTTVATNALLERKGERTLLLITKGFKDVLSIGNQARPNIFDIKVQVPGVLYERVIQVNERITLDQKGTITGRTGEQIQILQKLELGNLKNELLKAKSDGIESVAICLLHSYTFSDHEHILYQLCKQIGFSHVSMSSSMPMIKFVPRGNSCVTDAYLTPCITRYLDGFFKGFDQGIKNVKIEFMQSDGGLAPVEEFNGFKAILSGPAAGVVGYAVTSWKKGSKPVIGFDMGGTSTDVSRFDGSFDHVFETTTAGITIQAPQLDIQTVAAGGGSRLFIRNGLFAVGPESAGANPGPVCYRKGGYLSITDANLVLGRLIPEYFPKIFGPMENEPLDVQSAKKEFQTLANETGLSVDEVAFGFIKVANESMCRPIRALTEGKGFNAADHVLACFGGAGGQHAFAIARTLGIKDIVIHKYSSILSAYGLSLAQVVFEAQEPCATMYQGNMDFFHERFQVLKSSLVSKLPQGLFEFYLNMRFVKTDTALMIKCDDGDYKSAFLKQYEREFGFVLDREIIVDDIRVRGVDAEFAFDQVDRHVTPKTKTTGRTTKVYFAGGRVDTPVHLLSELVPGDLIQGPALIINNTATIVVEPDCSALITPDAILGKLSEKKTLKRSTDLDPILLSVFSHRFMSIAEQMGKTLQKTSISTNIKERLDFSCALFGPDGGLVSNAPHIPVHLGSMQEAVKWQMKNAEFKPGDVLLTNHPVAGGSHLPDMTVITPVYHDGKVVFFVASRGHHADIGGIQAGSMPPNSKELYEEGAAIHSFKLVNNGVFDEDGVKRILYDEPGSYPGCSGTRCLSDNISDLKAQVAANQRGIILVSALIKEYSLEVVQAYMKYIQQNAADAVKGLLETFPSKLHAIDYMDDGTKIELTISIAKGKATFDFTGTDSEVYGNINAPKSVTYSAIIYCLRCLVDMDIPLNQGALDPIKIIIPPSSFLNPSDSAAVVGGNVMTSQRLCDVIFKAFGACAASQGCCNNLTFGRSGDKGFGFYETIGGGCGATPSSHGTSGRHSHMTNTRITDVEIMERRYPVIIREFGYRQGSGGDGQFVGGDGLVREIEFTEPLSVSILSERRVFAPFGLNGGKDGKKGKNILIRNGKSLNFGGKNTVMVNAGDRLRIETPGGGGYGKK